MTTKLVKIFHDTIACARFNKLATLNEVNVLLVNYTPITVVGILCVTEYIYIRTSCYYMLITTLLGYECIKLHIHLTVCRYMMLSNMP